MGNTKKLIFFLRHYGGIDHIVPVVYKYASTTDIPIDLVVTSKREFLDDFRVEYISELEDVKVWHIEDVTDIDSYVLDSHRQKERKQRVISAVKDLGSRLPTHIPSRVYNSVVSSYNPSSGQTQYYEEGFLDKLFERLEADSDDVVAVFDWLTRNQPAHNRMREIVDVAKGRGHSTVSLPRGDAPYYNPIIVEGWFDDILRGEWISELHGDLYEPAFSEYEKLNVFDRIAVPNALMNRRLRPHYQDGTINKDSTDILGSPRYNEEWLEILDTITPEYDADDSTDLRILLFDRKSAYNLKEKEIADTVRLVSQMPDTHLVVKQHPHGGLDYDRLSDLGGVSVVGNEVHSPSVLDWADVVLDLGTSVAFEGVVRGDPVLCLEYSHSNYHTVSHYIEASEMMYKEELYDTLAGMIADGPSNFYTEGRDEFIEEMIQASREDTLQAYVDFIDGEM